MCLLRHMGKNIYYTAIISFIREGEGLDRTWWEGRDWFQHRYEASSHWKESLWPQSTQEFPKVSQPWGRRANTWSHTLANVNPEGDYNEHKLEYVQIMANTKQRNNRTGRELQGWRRRRAKVYLERIIDLFDLFCFLKVSCLNFRKLKTSSYSNTDYSFTDN